MNLSLDCFDIIGVFHTTSAKKSQPVAAGGLRAVHCFLSWWCLAGSLTDRSTVKLLFEDNSTYMGSRKNVVQYLGQKNILFYFTTYFWNARYNKSINIKTVGNVSSISAVCLLLSDSWWFKSYHRKPAIFLLRCYRVFFITTEVTYVQCSLVNTVIPNKFHNRTISLNII